MICLISVENLWRSNQIKRFSIEMPEKLASIDIHVCT